MTTVELSTDLDPDVAAVLALLAGSPRVCDGTPEEGRALYRAGTVGLRDPQSLAPVGSVTEDVLAGRPARVYRPFSEKTSPTVLFVHGGGYVIGDLDTHDDHARLLCHRLGAVVISLDYRLAPEHSFPAGYDDVVAALVELHRRIDDFGGDASRVGVGGDSAGGNLSVGAAVAARDLGLPLAAQLLLYPGTDFRDLDYPSRQENAVGRYLTLDDMVWFDAQYRPDPLDPRATVLLADLRGVAPAVVVTAGHDPLRDEGLALVEALRAAGVEVVAQHHPSLLHALVSFAPVSPVAAEAAEQAVQAFGRLLGATS